MDVTGSFRSYLGQEGLGYLLTQLPRKSNRGDHYLVLEVGVRSNNAGLRLGTPEVPN